VPEPPAVSPSREREGVSGALLLPSLTQGLATLGAGRLGVWVLVDETVAR